VIFTDSKTNSFMNNSNKILRIMVSKTLVNIYRTCRKFMTASKKYKMSKILKYKISKKLKIKIWNKLKIKRMKKQK